MTAHIRDNLYDLVAWREEYKAKHGIGPSYVIDLRAFAERTRSYYALGTRNNVVKLERKQK